MVWHAALWATMKKYINTNLIRVIKNLYNKAISAVLFNSSLGDWFRTTVGVRQGCLLTVDLQLNGIDTVNQSATVSLSDTVSQSVSVNICPLRCTWLG